MAENEENRDDDEVAKITQFQVAPVWLCVKTIICTNYYKTV